MAKHSYDGVQMSCKRCKATYEQCMDGISCGLIRCKECTLLRVCYGDTYDECRENIARALEKITYHSWSLTKEAYEKLAIDIMNDALKRIP